MGKRKKKKKPPGGRYRIFVDYENAPDCLPLIEKYDFEGVWIFVGRQQKKIPLELVQRMQRLGRAVHWVSPGAVGKNALDFILAMHVGMHHARTEEELAFAVFSADRGFDPLIAELGREGRKAVRVNPERSTFPRTRVQAAATTGSGAKGAASGAAAASGTTATGAKKAKRSRRKKANGAVSPEVAELADRVRERLARMGQERRPGRMKSLLAHVESQLPSTRKASVEAVIRELERRKFIAVDGRTNAVEYPGLVS
jgi:ribosomal protein S8E